MKALFHKKGGIFLAYDFFKATEKEFNKVYRIMEESFPECEMRSRVKMYELLTQQDNYSIVCVGSIGRLERNVNGFIVVWELDDIVFFENFAIERHMRGKGLGGLLFDLVMKNTTKPIVLEVEPPVKFSQKRRVSFYENHKMIFNNYDYLMPPLKTGNEFLPLNLMSYPRPLKGRDFNFVKEIIHREVYNYSDGDSIEIIY